MDRLRLFIAGVVALALLCGGPANAGDPASGTLNVVGEFTPSSSLAAGATIESQGFEQKARFTRTVMRTVPLEELAVLFGLDSRGFKWSYRSGGCQQSIAPNLLVSVDAGEHARVAAFALAWMYVYQQDAVPYFAASPGAGRSSVRLAFEKDLTPDRERAMFASLVAALGKDAGYTRVGEREIVVIDFDERGAFAADIARFASSMFAANPVVRAERFTTQSEYPTHDWRAEPGGTSLLARIGRVLPAPGIEAQLRALRTRYQEVLSGWLAIPAAGREQDLALSLVQP
jgi:hypothetical protein